MNLLQIVPSDVPQYNDPAQNDLPIVDPFEKMNMSQIDPPSGDGLFKSMVKTMVSLARTILPGTEGLDDAG